MEERRIGTSAHTSRPQILIELAGANENVKSGSTRPLMKRISGHNPSCVKDCATTTTRLEPIGANEAIRLMARSMGRRYVCVAGRLGMPTDA